MAIREIETADLGEVHTLLCEGFPRRSPAYWSDALDLLSARPPVAGLPRLGVCLKAEGRIEGALLSIAAEPRPGVRLCNLSSWYVRPDHRRMSLMMMRKILRAENVTFLDCSPAPPIVPLIEKFGFVPYTGGMVLLDPRHAFGSGGRVEWIAPGTLDGDDRIARHISAGCGALMAESRDGRRESLLFRTKRVRGVLPLAYFVKGSPEMLQSVAGPLLRTLMARGYAGALFDTGPGQSPRLGTWMPRREVRWVKGTPPETGDLLDTELALFGP